MTNCQGKGNCHHGETCLTHHLWEDLSGQIHDFLSQISLGDLMEGGVAEELHSRAKVLQTLSLRYVPRRHWAGGRKYVLRER